MIVTYLLSPDIEIISVTFMDFDKLSDPGGFNMAAYTVIESYFM